MDFSVLFRGLLESQNITQAELARRAGDNQSHLNATLNGRAKPALPRVHTWAQALALDDATRRTFVLAAIRCHVPDNLLSILDEIAGSVSIEAGALREKPAHGEIYDDNLGRQLEAVTAERDDLQLQLDAMRNLLLAGDRRRRYAAEADPPRPGQPALEIRREGAETHDDVDMLTQGLAMPDAPDEDTARAAREATDVDLAAIQEMLQHAPKEDEPPQPQRPRRPSRRAPARS